MRLGEANDRAEPFHVDCKNESIWGGSPSVSTVLVNGWTLRSLSASRKMLKLFLLIWPSGSPTGLRERSHPCSPCKS